MAIAPISAPTSRFIARPTRTLVTNGNQPHDPRAWATAVAAGMVAISEDMPIPRKAVAVTLQRQIASILCDAFKALTPATSLDTINQMTADTLVKINALLARSHWAFAASAPEITAEFQRYIALNLADAAQLIRRLE